ncbi:DELLA protein GAIP-B-like [Carya illinoinensis]|uniref:DELLA protein GAIP-B-like n=1 Tax=Carya illinoinensis TaxID=32201 RepID=UPI001C71C444|nr:DELLA protein GAIP-B-like [Carya illinoinensis]
MAEVAQKLELPDDLMCNAQGDGLSQLTYKTVHYNPYDLSTWLQSMLSEFNPLPVNGFNPMVPHATGVIAPPAPLDDSLLAPTESSTITSIDFDQENNINHSSTLRTVNSSDKFLPLQAQTQTLQAQTVLITLFHFKLKPRRQLTLRNGF